MEQNNYNIVKTADGSMTTYRVVGAEQADDAAICRALTEAAKDVWQYLAAMPGVYAAAEMRKTGLSLRDGFELPMELRTLRVECGKFNFCVKPIDDYGRPNYSTIFSVLSEFESLARVKQNDRAMFIARMELGGLLCEARVVLPPDMKAVCAICGNDPLRPSVSYPALDLDRRCIVATDGRLMVAKKVTVAYIHYEDKVPETFYLPKEVARMQGEVTVQLFERGCAVIDRDGVIAEVEHVEPYPKWHTVWPKYRGGMTIVDGKALAKVVKCVAGALPCKGKGLDEVMMLNHYGASDALCIRGYDNAEKISEQRIGGCVTTDEVPYRLTVDYRRLLKALALKPQVLWMGYGEMSALPDRLMMEDARNETAVMLFHKLPEDLEDVLRETEAGYAVGDSRQLQRCYDADGWLLEQVETKYPACGSPEQSKPKGSSPKSAPARRKKEEVRRKSNPAPLTLNPAPLTVNSEPSLADRLRAALRAQLAA